MKMKIASQYYLTRRAVYDQDIYDEILSAFITAIAGKTGTGDSKFFIELVAQHHSSLLDSSSLTSNHYTTSRHCAGKTDLFDTGRVV